MAIIQGCPMEKWGHRGAEKLQCTASEGGRVLNLWPPSSEGGVESMTPPIGKYDPHLLIAPL